MNLIHILVPPGVVISCLALLVLIMYCCDGRRLRRVHVHTVNPVLPLYGTPGSPGTARARVEVETRTCDPLPPLELESCAICLEEMTPVYKGKGSTLTRANCGHYYHRVCLQTWINTFGTLCPTCPLCKRPTFHLENYAN